MFLHFGCFGDGVLSGLLVYSVEYVEGGKTWTKLSENGIIILKLKK